MNEWKKGERTWYYYYSGFAKFVIIWNLKFDLWALYNCWHSPYSARWHFTNIWAEVKTELPSCCQSVNIIWIINTAGSRGWQVTLVLDKTAPLVELPLIWPGMHTIDHNYSASSYSTTNTEKERPSVIFWLITFTNLYLTSSHSLFLYT